MKKGFWGWFWGVISAIGTAVTIWTVLTNDVSLRDYAYIGLGAILGVGVAGLVASFLFHRADRGAEEQERREQRKAAEKAALENERRESEARIAREQQVLDKKLELFEALPTRKERLNQLAEDLAQANIDAAEAKGNSDMAKRNMVEAQQIGYAAMVAELNATASGWSIRHAQLRNKVINIQEEITATEALTDEEFLAQQKHLRGLD